MDQEEEIQSLRERNRELEDKIEDYDDAARIAANEKCTNNEHHCTCVPLLRFRIKELEEMTVKYEREIRRHVERFQQFEAVREGNKYH